MGNKIILNAISSLNSKVDISNVTIGEKNALKALLSQLLIYFNNQYDEILTNYAIKDRLDKISALNSEITDYLVDINNAINGISDVFSIVNSVYKSINYDERKGKFKRKRLI